MVVLLLYRSISTKLNFFCFGDARRLLNMAFSDPAKIVKKVKEMSRENSSVEEKSVVLIQFLILQTSLHPILL